MGSGIQILLDKLHDPDAASFVIVLVVVALVSFIASFIAAVKLLPKLRKAGLGFSAKNKTHLQESIVIYLKQNAAFRRFLEKLFVTDDSRLKPLQDEIRSLKEQLSQSETDKRKIRDDAAKTMRRAAELEGEIDAMRVQQNQEQKGLAIETQRRRKVQEKVETLETQLQAAIAETERIYQQTSLLEAKPGAPPEQHLSVVVANQNAEIAQLKKLLAIAKQRLMEYSDKSLPKTGT